MTKKERIIRASHMRMMLYTALNTFNVCEKWEKYIECAMMIHECEALLKESEKK